MQGKSTIIRNPEIEDGSNASKVFSFDYSYWSVDKSNESNFADQGIVFNDLGINILENAFKGLFPYSLFLMVQT